MKLTRSSAHELLAEYIANPSLQRHCQMVATAMEAYAQKLGKSSEEAELWYITGLLHDLDWEQFPDEHPLRAINSILPSHGAPPEMLQAIAAHAPARSGRNPHSELDKYLFACDELSGFLDALAKVRPGGFDGMQWSSVKKKLKAAAFAANVSREDIAHGAELIQTTLNEHTETLIQAFHSAGF